MRRDYQRDIQDFETRELQGYSGGYWRGVCTVAMTLLLCMVVEAQNLPTKATAVGSNPRLTGLWDLTYDNRNVPPAILTPTAAGQQQAIYEHDLFARRWCHFAGMPQLMEEAPLDILQRSDGKEIVISSQAQGIPRHIYVDGRKHEDLKTFDLTTMGNSIGRWEGEVLVVDTIGFSDQGISRIPGGGLRTHNSHLTERYRLIENGRGLVVTFTWDDPAVFQKPHVYEYLYYRAPEGVEPRQFYCDASDEDRANILSSRSNQK